MTGYNYDVLDRLSSVTYPSAPSTTAYTYDGVGNRLTQQVDANPATVNTYDEADQLKTIDGVTNGYDVNGDLLSIGIGANLPNTFLYDQENRLFREGPCRADVQGDGKVNSTDQIAIASHYGNTGSTTYDLSLDLNADLKINSTDGAIAAAEFNKNCKGTSGNGRSWYDGDGLRVRQRTFLPSGTPFAVNDDYVWDTGAGLPVVLQDTRTLGTNPPATTTYLYGLGLISETSGAGVTSYYLADGLGSTTQLTDSAGATTDSYAYDVFGAPRTVTGTTANDFRYTGQQRDGNANRGLYYLRARSYDPALGRFLQRDPLPLLNRYAYVGNNSANFADPTGLCCNPTDLVKDSVGLIGETASWAWDNRTCVALGGAVGCAALQGARGAASWARNQLIQLCPEKSSGYVDLNFTAGAGAVGAVGAQCTREQGFHTYYGAGPGAGLSLSATYGRHQSITSGTFCGAQGTYGRGNGGGTVNGGIGGIDALWNLRLPIPFFEAGGSRSANAGLSGSLICGVVN